MSRLPEIGGDEDQWGTLLNEFLRVSHNEDGTIKQNYSVVNVKDFGAVGDGETDDYNALLQAAAAINEMGGGTLVFPPGTYRIDQYKITGGSAANSVQDIIFKDCNGLKIIGYSAKIDVKGDFDRQPREGIENDIFSYSNSVVPFMFLNCYNFSLEGFEINGNVDQMTRHPSVAETAPGHGVVTAGCSQFTFSNLYIHHFQVDGIALAARDSSGKNLNHNAIFLNVRCLNNARLGMSIDQLDGGLFLGCQFSYSGITDGSYGGHAPQSGVDIEPGHEATRTSNITFLSCEFRENVGHQFAATKPQTTSNVYIDRCRIIHRKAEQPEPLAVILAVTNGCLTNSYIDAKDGFINATAYDGSTAKIVNCQIHSSDLGIASDRPTPLHIEQCQFIGTFTKPSTRVQPYLINSHCQFIHNYVFRPRVTYQEPSGVRTDNPGSIIQVRLSERNAYYTDLVPSPKPAPEKRDTEHFFVSYASDTVVDNDLYSGNQNHAFRPETDTSTKWNTSLPYSQGLNCLDIALIGPNRHFSADKPPDSGTYLQGDIIYNSRPTAGGNVGWVCIVSSEPGKPGEWRAFGAISEI